MRLNLACGNQKFKNCINADVESSLNPDIVMDLKGTFPFKDGEFDEIYLFHTIEHIQKRSHPFILAQIHRVLNPNGTFYISYPEFGEIAKNWLDNKGGQREFWENTIYGRQAHKSDYHVCAMDSTELVHLLRVSGFVDIIRRQEPPNKWGVPEYFNTILTAKKGRPFISYEEVLYNDISMRPNGNAPGSPSKTK